MTDATPLHPAAKRLLRMLAVSTRGGGGEVAQRRADLEAFYDLGEDAPTDALSVHDFVIPGPGGNLTLRAYAQPGRIDAPGLIFLHGGGWVAGSLRTHDGLCRRLAEAADCTVVAIDYRLAPEHRFPAALDDAVAAFDWIARHAADLGLDPARLGLAGDSAGGGLAVAAALALARVAGPSPAQLLLICPILDLSQASASRHTFAEGYFLDAATLAADLDHYLPPGHDRADPRVSPLLALDLELLPPTLIHTAQYDPFHDEGAALAERLASLGVPVGSADHAGMIHYFYALPRTLAYARDAAALMGEQIKANWRPDA